MALTHHKLKIKQVCILYFVLQDYGNKACSTKFNVYPQTVDKQNLMCIPKLLIYIYIYIYIHMLKTFSCPHIHEPLCTGSENI